MKPLNLRDLITHLPKSWHSILANDKELLTKIETLLNKASLDLYPLGIYPSRENIFRAFQFKELQDIRVVIIGQDCYHGPNQATGLCFAVDNEITCPPSLRNIKRELQEDMGYPLQYTNLTNWANQGVLLLNSALTVHESIAGSHLKIWSPYTDLIIKNFSEMTNNVVYLLWGNYAKSKVKLIATNNNHYILEANHPSPLSANRGGWFGCKHFSKTNEYLITLNKPPINWS